MDGRIDKRATDGWMDGLFVFGWLVVLVFAIFFAFFAHFCIRTFFADQVELTKHIPPIFLFFMK